MRGSRRTDYHICFHQRCGKFRKRSVYRTKTVGESYSMKWRSINDDEPLSTIIAEVMGSEFTHLASSNEQYACLIQIRKMLLRQSYCYKAYRSSVTTDSCLAASTLASYQGSTK